MPEPGLFPSLGNGHGAVLFGEQNGTKEKGTATAAATSSTLPASYFLFLIRNTTHASCGLQPRTPRSPLSILSKNNQALWAACADAELSTIGSYQHPGLANSTHTTSSLPLSFYTHTPLWCSNTWLQFTRPWASLMQDIFFFKCPSTESHTLCASEWMGNICQFTPDHANLPSTVLIF